MPEPRRVQLVSRNTEHCPDRPCIFHGVVPDGAVYIGRRAGGLPESPAANPFRGPDAADRYRVKLLCSPGLLAAVDEYVGDADVACWCRPDVDCHGDHLLELLAGYRESRDEDPEGWA